MAKPLQNETEPPLSRVMRTPRSLDIDITARCNLRCRYCYFFQNPAVDYLDLPTAQWLKFFDELGSLGVMKTVLAGGEPFGRGRPLGRGPHMAPDGEGKSRRRASLLERGTSDRLRLFNEQNRSARRWDDRPLQYVTPYRTGSHQPGFSGRDMATQPGSESTASATYHPPYPLSILWWMPLYSLLHRELSGIGLYLDRSGGSPQSGCLLAEISEGGRHDCMSTQGNPKDQKAGDGTVPSLNMLYFYLTEGCNLACRHCWLAPKFDTTGQRYPALPVELFQTAIREAKPLGLSGVKLTGGEPLLHRQFTGLLEIVRREELHLTIETNGLLCTREIAAEIAKTPKRFVSVSIDGVDARPHEWVRGVQDSFQAAKQAEEAGRFPASRLAKKTSSR